MNITYEVAHTKDELSALAAICLEAKLYEDDGLLRNHYNVIISQKQVRKMCIVLQRCNGQPSGAIVCFVTAQHVNTFIKPGFRRKGLGSKLVARLRTELGLERSLLIGTEGYDGWENFFENNFIYVAIHHFSIEEIKQWTVEQLVVKVNFKPKRAMLARLHRWIKEEGNSNGNHC